ncbi:hypothetical protein MLD38_004398 [Melastoma candidum]|uniref:Uncharacterized protein n=1 Tax=Melastoma candidum TaxID=119954 RepID=A0ACB9SE46_9MYRT|nr:hypothetical protein MLD38_004398 [Melastoma candidum]
MLAAFLLSFIGAISKLRPTPSLDFGLFVPGFVAGLPVAAAVVGVVVSCFMLLRIPLQRSNLGSWAASMRLRPKRTCFEVVCFGGFHIKRFVSLFLFLRGDLT